MILDERNEFADALIIPTSAGTAAGGDVIDLRGMGLVNLGSLRDVGNGADIWFYAQIDTTAVGGTSFQIQLVSSAAADLSSPNIHYTSAAIVTASLTAGKRIAMISLPLEDPAYLRYLGIRTIVVGTYSLGNYSAGLTLDAQGWKAYADAVN